MPAHEDALLMAAGPLKPGEYYDFDHERVCELPTESMRREQGLKDVRAERPRLSQDPVYLRGYELGERFRSLHGN